MLAGIIFVIVVCFISVILFSPRPRSAISDLANNKTFFLVIAIGSFSYMLIYLAIRGACLALAKLYSKSHASMRNKRHRTKNELDSEPCQVSPQQHINRDHPTVDALRDRTLPGKLSDDGRA